MLNTVHLALDANQIETIGHKSPRGLARLRDLPRGTAKKDRDIESLRPMCPPLVHDPRASTSAHSLRLRASHLLAPPLPAAPHVPQIHNHEPSGNFRETAKLCTKPHRTRETDFLRFPEIHVKNILTPCNLIARSGF